MAKFSESPKVKSRELPFDKFSAIYRKQISNTENYRLICERDNQVIGILNLRFEEQLHLAAYIAEIMEFAVDPAIVRKMILRKMK